MSSYKIPEEFFNKLGHGWKVRFQFTSAPESHVGYIWIVEGLKYFVDAIHFTERGVFQSDNIHHHLQFLADYESYHSFQVFQNPDRCVATRLVKYHKAQQARKAAEKLQKCRHEEKRNRVYRCEWCLGYHHSPMTKAEYYNKKENFIISKVIAHAMYGKSSNPFAEENASIDFQNGYSAGMKTNQSTNSRAWRNAWKETYNRIDSEGWKNWKRGFWAGDFDRISSKTSSRNEDSK